MPKTPYGCTSGVFRQYLSDIVPEDNATSKVFSEESFSHEGRYTWINSPAWWNPVGEKIYQAEENKIWLCYWRSPIALHSLKRIERRESV